LSVRRRGIVLLGLAVDVAGVASFRQPFDAF
jgi:hypothetical protein